MGSDKSMNNFTFCFSLINIDILFLLAGLEMSHLCARGCGWSIQQIVTFSKCILVRPS